MLITSWHFTPLPEKNLSTKKKASMSHSSPTAGASGGTEREKMLRGELYDASDPEFDAPHHRCAAAVAAFNNAPPDLPRRERVTLQNKYVTVPVYIYDMIYPKP